MRFTSLGLLLVPSFLAACGSDPAATTTGGGGSTGTTSTTTGSGGKGGSGGGEGVVLCTSSPLVVPTADFFKDISEKSGIQDQNFVSMPPMPIPINDHSRLAFADIDGDGFDDLVAHSLFPNPQGGVPFEHLVFRNKGDGTFENVSDASGLRNVQAGFFLFGDIDNDGDQDVFAGLDVPLPGLTNQVLLNDGKGHFTVLPKSGLEGSANNTVVGSASFADFNNDGKLDIYLANGQTSYAAADQLFIGKGDGTFTNGTGARLKGGNPQRPSNGVVVCDYDNDGDQDIFVSTYGVSIELGHKILWENDGTGVFTNVAEARGFAAQAEGNSWLASTGNGKNPEPGKDASSYVGSNGFGIDCDDINGDGLDDIYLATISHPVSSDYSRKWSDPSQILINQGKEGAFAFKNEALARKLPFNEGDIDAALCDFDNDGRLDLSVTRDNKYESGYATDDQKAWLGLMHQEKDGLFTSVGLASGINDPAGMNLPRMKAGQNLGWSDIDNDGDLDLLVGGRDHGGGRANFLFENTIGSKNTWLAVRLSGDGVKVNRDALGARVTLKFPTWTVMRELKSSRGTYTSADTRALHFGLGDLGCEYTLEVRWPDGTKLTLDGKTLPSNTFLKIDYAKGLLAP
jgi:hypothetical protein